MRSLAWIGVAAMLLFAGAANSAAASPADARQACAAAARRPTPSDPTGAAFAQLNPATAAPACRRAVELSPRDHASRANLGRALMKAKQYDEAFAALFSAAKAGNPQAQQNLASLYEDGHGVSKNPGEAIRWLRRAAAQRVCWRPERTGRELSVRRRG
jgi:TPR repeat protein